jgi:hypothetical protein
MEFVSDIFITPFQKKIFAFSFLTTDKNSDSKKEKRKKKRKREITVRNDGIFIVWYM